MQSSVTSVTNLFHGINQIMWAPTSKHLYVTRVVDAIMEIKKNSLNIDDVYEYFDPKITTTTIPRKNTPFREAIVFVIGGGNYVEYQNLMDYAKEQKGSQLPKHIIYGTTEMLSATQFLEQLAVLGHRSQTQ